MRCALLCCCPWRCAHCSPCGAPKRCSRGLRARAAAEPKASARRRASVTQLGEGQAAESGSRHARVSSQPKVERLRAVGMQLRPQVGRVQRVERAALLRGQLLPVALPRVALRGLERQRLSRTESGTSARPRHEKSAVAEQQKHHTLTPLSQNGPPLTCPTPACEFAKPCHDPSSISSSSAILSRAQRRDKRP